MSQIGFLIITIFMFLGLYHGLVNYYWSFKNKDIENIVNYVLLDIKFISFMFFIGLILVCVG